MENYKFCHPDIKGSKLLFQKMQKGIICNPYHLVTDHVFFNEDIGDI
jgi:hypothetical protein